MYWYIKKKCTADFIDLHKSFLNLNALYRKKLYLRFLKQGTKYPTVNKKKETFN